MKRFSWCLRKDFVLAASLLLLVAPLSQASSSNRSTNGGPRAVDSPTAIRAPANPFSPRYGHPYRHGVIPTLSTLAKMKQWRATHVSTTATSTNTLYYGGGTSSSSQGNVGVMDGKVKVYLVFYGSGWGAESTNANGDATFSGDPDGAAPVAQEMFKGIGTGNETWSAVLTQWCQGISAASSSCPSSTPLSDYVPYQPGDVLAGVWEDTSATTPINATATQLAQEAIAAANHFGNTTAASNRYAYYVIMSAHGDDPDNYQSSTNGYCAWHDWTGDYGVTSTVGDLAFSNQPYNMDAGSTCGVGFVNSPGTLDGWTMTLGHEWLEMMSDTYPSGGWTASSGNENADDCAWISSGQGAAANVTMGTGTFAEQSSWSNDTNECDLSHVIDAHAADGSISTTMNIVVSGTLSAAISDGDTLIFGVVTNPGHGSVSITNPSTGAFTYYPQLGYTGSDSFTFNATDSKGNVSDTATEAVTILPNSPPTASAGSVSTVADISVGGTLSAADPDGDSLTFAVVAQPGHGSVSITNSATGAFTFTPPSGYAGSDGFTFKATDAAGQPSNTANESVSVIDTAPAATGGSVSTTAGTAVSGKLNASDSNSGQTLTYSIVSQPSHGTVAVTNASTGAFTYKPASGYAGSDSFTFKVNDGYLDSNVATESVTVVARGGSGGGAFGPWGLGALSLLAGLLGLHRRARRAAL